MDSNQGECDSSPESNIADKVESDEEIAAKTEDVLILQSQVEGMRNRKHTARPLYSMDGEESIADSSSDFELSNDDVCDTDSEWSGSELMSLGLKMKDSVRSKLLSDSDSGSASEDHLPLSSLRKKRDDQELHHAEKIQLPNGRESTSSSTEINPTPETAVTGILHAAVITPTRITDEPLIVSIPDSFSAIPPSAQTVREETKSPLPSSSTVPIEPGPSSVASDIASEHIDQGTKKTCRKRPRQPSKWKQNKKKRLRNSGQAYIGFKGKQVPAKTMNPGCNEKCIKKCQQEFDDSERHDIFSNFWENGDINIQRQFIASCVTKTNPDRVRTKNPISRRKSTLNYSFVKAGVKKQVCRQFFLDTLGIKQDVVYGALEKVNSGGIVSVDGRGSHKNHVAVSDDVVEEIKSHIRSFPVVPSHYCRQSSDRMYLEADLNMSTMYRLYEELQKSKGKVCAKKSKYRDIFLKHFNIGFFSPKKDQCDMCLSFSSTPDPSQEQTQEHEAHLKRKETARDYKASIKRKATADPTIVASCFDLQKVLPCPHGEASSFYYKRKLSTYNLTFYDMSSQHVQCFMWLEHISGRGSNQIASCLWHYIQMHASQGKTAFNFISDNCAGQNRNRFVAAMFWFCIKTMPNVTKIEHGFLEVGHTQNENDSVHSVIAHAAKRIPVYTPGQWATVARGARRNKRPYAVKEMTAQDFFDFKAVSKKIKNLDNDEDGEKVRWTKIRAITFNQSENDSMTIHYDDKVCRVDLMRRKRKFDDPDGQLDLQVLSDLSGISEDKKKDLISLCSSNLIPPAHHQFFQNLPVLK